MLLAATLVAAAKPPRIKTVTRTWRMPYLSAVADSIPFTDTLMLNYYDLDIQTRYSTSSAMNGNILVSPIESRIIRERTYTIDDPFAYGFQPYVVTPQQQRFFNTTTPYSSIAYKRGFVSGHGENDLSFLFTGNLNKRFNLGTEMEYLHSAGHYASTAGKLFRGTLWGSYNSTHYTMHAAFSWSQLKSFDNGGLTDITDLRSKLRPEDIPCRLYAMTAYRYLSGYLHNQYTLTKEVQINDSTSEHIPLMTFSHVFETNDSRRRYIEKDPNQGFYDTTYYNSDLTRDSSEVLTIRNTAAITFCEAFNTKLKFGITAFAMNECQRFHTDTLLFDSIHPTKWYNNTFVGGAIHKHSGANIRYHLEGQVCVLGYKIGEFDVHAKLTTRFMAGQYPLEISARAKAASITPSPYLQHYTSNHIRWSQDLGFTYRFLGGAKIAYRTTWVTPSVDFSFENRTHPVFVSASDWMPHQYGGSVQIFTGDVGLDITTPWVNLENRAVVQHTTNDSILPVPLVILQHRLYYHGSWFRHAMDAQIGVDLRYFTRYHSPVLCPETGMFATQQSKRVGNHPWMSAYASFYVRSIRLRFFFQYQHLSYLFNRKSIDYLVMPDYPSNRDTFRAGLAWHFYN